MMELVATAVSLGKLKFDLSAAPTLARCAIESPAYLF
jgi:hypothetical protein